MLAVVSNVAPDWGGSSSLVTLGPASRRAALSKYRLPVIHAFRQYVTEGGLISYGPDTSDIVRRSASYVDRIFKGENPADLPVQAPTKYELLINLKAAKAIGLQVPPARLARADQVIE